MPAFRLKFRRALPGLIPGILVVLGEVAVAVLLIVYLHGQQRDLCHQLQRARATSNVTLRAPFRQFALDAAAARDRSGDHDVAKKYRKIAARVHDLPPLRC
jgi:hypothetical protein